MLPIPFIAVDLFRGPTRVDATHTNERGEFYFYDVEEGEYYVVAMSPIHNPVKQHIIIEPDDKVVEIELKTVKIHL